MLRLRRPTLDCAQTHVSFPVMVRATTVATARSSRSVFSALTALTVAHATGRYHTRRHLPSAVAAPPAAPTRACTRAMEYAMTVDLEQSLPSHVRLEVTAATAAPVLHHPRCPAALAKSALRRASIQPTAIATTAAPAPSSPSALSALTAVTAVHVSASRASTRRLLATL